MKKDDIINKIMEEFDIARIDAAEIVNNTFSILRNSLIKGKHINISEFGKFDVNYKKGENGKILKTISFSPVKKFSYDVNDSYNNLEPVTVAFITNFKEEDSAVDTDMEDYEEVIDEIDEKEFIKSRLTVVEEKTDEQTKFKEEIKEKFKETFKETFREDPSTPKDEQKPEEKIEGKLHKFTTDDRRKSFFESERYKSNTSFDKIQPKHEDGIVEETISDKILSDIIEPHTTQSSKEVAPDLTFIDREEPEEPLVVEFNQEVTEDVKEVETNETIDTNEQPEVHGYIPTEKEILDFEKIREELNNKIRETFGEITTPEPIAEDEIDNIDEVKEEEIQEQFNEEVQPALTEDIAEIESKDPEIRTPEESNILEEDLITQQEETEGITDKTNELKLEDLQNFRDMFEEKDKTKDKILDERDDLLKEIESKISEDFAKLDADDFKDIDSDTIKKIEDINKATEDKLKSQPPDDDIKIPDFDFKNLFKDTITKIPEEEIHEEFIEKFNEEVKDISKLEDKTEDFSFEGSDILIPEEIKQLHEEIQTVKPFEGIESKKEEGLGSKNDDDVKFDFFKGYNDIFEDKEGDADIVTHPSHGSQMPYPKNDVTDEQREGSKIFSLSILILIGIVIAVFAGIYFLLSSDLFKPKPTVVITDTVKTQSARPNISNSAGDSFQQSQDTTKGKDSVTASQQTQKPDTAKTQTTPPPVNNNQTASNPEDAQYRKLNSGEEEQINDPVNNVVYIRTSDGVFIQTGSYKDKAVADEKANALKKAGVQNISVVEVNLGAKGIYYRVRVGKYPTVQEAKNNSSKVKN